MTLEFVFSEFGSRDQANQRWKNPLPRLDPTYSSVKQYFPEAKLILYTDRPEIKKDYKDIEIKAMVKVSNITGKISSKKHQEFMFNEVYIFGIYVKLNKHG